MSDDSPPRPPEFPSETEPQTETQAVRLQIVTTATDISSADMPFILGPSGGTGGRQFSTGVIPGDAEVRTIHVRHGALINAVWISYQQGGGEPVELPMHGGQGGVDLSKFTLAPGEYVTRISGRYGKYVDSLKIETSEGNDPTYGGDGGDVQYQYEAPPGFEICGFGGKCSRSVDSIGPMYRRRTGSVERRPPFAQGPAGDFRGRAFRDPELPDGARIVGARIQSGRELDGIGLIYEASQRSRELGFHGGTGGNSAIFKLEDGEYIVGITGYYRNCVRGIRFITNRRISSPFGWENVGIPFVFKLNPLDCPNPGDYEVVGLLGSASDCINALGVIYRRRADDERGRPDQVPVPGLYPDPADRS